MMHCMRGSGPIQCCVMCCGQRLVKLDDTSTGGSYHWGDCGRRRVLPYSECVHCTERRFALLNCYRGGRREEHVGDGGQLQPCTSKKRSMRGEATKWSTETWSTSCPACYLDGRTMRTWPAQSSSWPCDYAFETASLLRRGFFTGVAPMHEEGEKSPKV